MSENPTEAVHPDEETDDVEETAPEPSPYADPEIETDGPQDTVPS